MPLLVITLFNVTLEFIFIMIKIIWDSYVIQEITIKVILLKIMISFKILGGVYLLPYGFTSRPLASALLLSSFVSIFISAALRIHRYLQLASHTCR